MPETKLTHKILLVSLGIILGLMLLEGMLFLGGKLFLTRQYIRNQAALKRKGDIVILCVGESTTALGGEHSYPVQLERILNQRSSGKKFTVINAGVPSITTGNILANINYYMDIYKPDIVVSMMGINDVIYGEDDSVSYKDYIYDDASDVQERFKTAKLFSLLMQHLRSKFGFNKDVSTHEKNNNEAVPFLGTNDGYGAQSQTYNKTEKADSEDSRLIALGIREMRKPNPKKAKKLFEHALEINPRNEWAYLELGLMYRYQDYKKAEEYYKKALDINPLNPETYYRMGHLYIYWDIKEDEGRKSFERALELDPTRISAYMELVSYYQRKQLPDDVEKVYKQCIKMNPHSSWGYAGLANFYASKGQRNLAREYMDMVDHLRRDHQNEVTRYNYNLLKDILESEDIPLVAVQYPMLDVQVLKDMLGDDGQVVFVDNQATFRKAVEENGYRSIFSDNFAGDFGHCTSTGNEILASNIADSILNFYQM